MRLVALEVDSCSIITSMVLSIGLSHDSSGDAHLILTEKTDTRRVGANRRNICTESLHGSTHTYISCGTIKTVFSQLGILVGFLS